MREGESQEVSWRAPEKALDVGAASPTHREGGSQATKGPVC